MSTSTILLEAGLSQNEINTLDGELIKIIEKFYQPIEIKHMPRNLLLQGANALLEAFKEDEMLKDSINKSESGFSEEEKALLTKIKSLSEKFTTTAANMGARKNKECY